MDLVAISTTHLDIKLFILLWKLLYCQFGIWLNNELETLTEAYWNISKVDGSLPIFLTWSGSRRLLCYLATSWDFIARNIWNAHGTAFVVHFEKSRVQSPTQANRVFTAHWRTTVAYHIPNETGKAAPKLLYW